MLDDLRALYRHNSWANRKVFGLCARLDRDAIEAPAPGTIGTAHETLAHLARVEEAWLGMIEGRSLDTLEPREVFLSRDVRALGERLERIGAAFEAWLERATDQDLTRVLPVKWFEAPISAREGVYEVFSHSAQHRSQVLSTLGGRGMEVPDLDYVLMLEEEWKAGRE